MRFIMSLKEPTSEFNNYPATVMHEYGIYDSYFFYVSIKLAVRECIIKTIRNDDRVSYFTYVIYTCISTIHDV